MNSTNRLHLLLFLTFAALFCGHSHAADRKPNIVVIMADDLGWRDLHCYGNKKLDTPSLDQLAAEGMRFTHGYGGSRVCTPKRAVMMTGQSPARLRITNDAPGNPIKGRKLGETTVAGRPTILPSITGKAWITGFLNTFSVQMIHFEPDTF